MIKTIIANSNDMFCTLHFENHLGLFLILMFFLILCLGLVVYAGCHGYITFQHCCVASEVARPLDAIWEGPNLQGERRGMKEIGCV